VVDITSLTLACISLIWHPWSLARFDPDMRMLRLTLSYACDRGPEPTTYAVRWQLSLDQKLQKYRAKVKLTQQIDIK